jgi:geranylgeranyl pyrophosphate synthase
MNTFDFSLLKTDLVDLEERLRQYGSKPVKDEISLNQLFVDHLASGGSRTRAMLALAAGHSQSLNKSARLSIAASVELLHQASLIHDDVQDEDSTRRGKASVWAVAGKSSAICLGDDLIGAAFEELAQLPGSHIHQLPRLVTMLSRGISVMAAGQTIDCRWTPDEQLSFLDYEQIVRHKSGPLLGLPIAMVLALTGGSDDQILQVLAGASSIGVAYQLADDLSDQAEDFNQRLNGYWVLAETITDGADPESVLRERFDWHLENARYSVQTTPQFCIEAFEVLIQALHQKYPTFEVAA